MHNDQDDLRPLTDAEIDATAGGFSLLGAITGFIRSINRLLS
jgi:hypothetical protein